MLSTLQNKYMKIQISHCSQKLFNNNKQKSNRFLPLMVEGEKNILKEKKGEMCL